MLSVHEVNDLAIGIRVQTVPGCELTLKLIEHG